MGNPNAPSYTVNTSPPEPVKPGVKSSEFWLTLITAACGLVQGLTGAHTGASIGATALAAGTVAAYTASRGYVKGNAASSGGN